MMGIQAALVFGWTWSTWCEVSDRSWQRSSSERFGNIFLSLKPWCSLAWSTLLLTSMWLSPDSSLKSHVV